MNVGLRLHTRSIGAVCGLALACLALACLALLAGSVGRAAAAAPTAAVAMGDSEISGEGAGSYEGNTNGPNNYCHRSANAWIKKITVGVSVDVNLACSGANSSNLTLGGETQYEEKTQAAQLEALARTDTVKDIFVTVGANDNPDFSGTVEDCVFAYVFLEGEGNGCKAKDGPSWTSRVDAMEPKAEAAIASIKSGMSKDGYSSSSYQVVVVSYADPAPKSSRYADWEYPVKLVEGCPLYNSDAEWGHNVATPGLDAGERTIAQVEGVRFLDMVESFEGHELCGAGIGASQQWVNGLLYEPSLEDWWNEHAVQQSFHPNAKGHSQLAKCVNGFLEKTYKEGICRVNSGGNDEVHEHP
jgi:lysophospholipase L1-like esterase